MKSKTIILNSQTENKSGRAILTLYDEDELLKCRMRLYNTPKLTRQAKIGIYHQNQVYKANLIERGGAYESSLVGDFDFDQDFYSAIINTENNNQVLLAGGTYAGFFFNDNSVFSSENEVETAENNSAENTTPNSCSMCENCKYKEYFYAEKQSIPPEPTPAKESEFESELTRALAPQFDYVFANYPANTELNSLLPNSKFAMVKENQKEYSIGAIYENNEMKFICYATKCDYNAPPPAELGPHFQWLPIDKEDPLSMGYYLVFQDAKDLKIIDI